MKALLLILITGLLQSAHTEVTNCAVYESTNLCFNSTFIQISRSTGSLKFKSFPEMAAIQTVEFVLNNLTDIEPKLFLRFPNLSGLIIRGNDKFPNITKNLLKHCKNLTKLEIYFNLGLNHIDENVLKNFPNLEEFVVLSERIQHLKRHDLKIVSDLRVLKLDLTTLKKIDSNAFEPIGNLEELSLMANNYLKINYELFNSIPKLKYLNLIYAEITDLSFLKKLPKIENLRLGGNKIQSIFSDTFENSNQLRILDLAHTGIQHIDTSAYFFSNVPNLKEIDITCHKLGNELYDIAKFSDHDITIIDKHAGSEINSFCGD